ncbi:hypothetical protein FBUS_00482 [Fasciolopsis buskii]|uniref:Coatomer subunit epsilon n=1 Tax=Fasciolopsis buskii TaxID=27845 RepID=A0A8E0RJ53_9TREM|nr:hypothetical protein FBUS_00482 [Fasciolopsis buski]
MSDLELIDAFQAYLLGNFSGALKSLQKIRKKFGVVLDEIPEDTDCVELRVLRTMALFFAKPLERDHLIKELDNIMSGSIDSEDDTVLVLAATIYLNSGVSVFLFDTVFQVPEKALKVLHQGNDTNWSVLSDLGGGEQLQEALHIYEELREKHGPTSVILNGQAAALIGMNRWEEAETVLAEALDLDGNNPDIIVNMIMVAHHLNKPPEAINRLISQLKDSNKDHPFLLDQVAKVDEFTRCAQQYAPAVPN